MKLDEITPFPLISNLDRNWIATIPSWIVAAAIVLPALFFKWPQMWLFSAIGVAIVAAIATDLGMMRLRHYLRIRIAMTPPRSFPDPPEMDITQRAERWTELLGDKAIRSFVLFSYGTCVVSIDENDDPAIDAKTLLQACGHPIAGTPSSDMLIYNLPDTGDFVIGGHHPNIFTYVSGDCFSLDTSSVNLKSAAGYYGRQMRDLDAFALDVIHTKKMENSQQ